MTRTPPALFLCALLSACTPSASDSASGDSATCPTASDLLGAASTESVVTVACAYTYTDANGTVTCGEYPSFESSCDRWAESGEQSLESTRMACEQAGLDAGQASVACECAEDVGTCTFPGGVND